MKRILIILCVFLSSYSVCFANNTVHFGYGMYVGGVNVADAKAELSIDKKNNYTFKALIFSQGFTNFLTSFNFITTSKGKILDKTVKFKSQISSSTSNFGDTHTVLKRENNQTTIIKYPDPEKVDIENLPGNPLAKANDPISSILTLMQQIKLQKKCDINMVIITNHYLYQAKSQATDNKVLKADNYNLAEGNATSCLVKFERLDEQDELSAYDKLGNNTANHESTYPIFHFIKLKGIPYYIPVSIEATEKRFGAFRLNLQYVRYGDTKYQVPEWDEEKSFSQQDIQELKLVSQKLLAESKNN